MTESPKGLYYQERFLDVAQQEELLSEIGNLEFEANLAFGRPMLRRQAQYGYTYITSGRQIQPATAFPPFLTELGTAILEFCPPDAPLFNQCIVTQYRAKSGIGWHTDHPQFGDCIAGVSVGMEAVMEFKRIAGEGTSKVHTLNVAPGSLYVMSGEARHQWQHRVKRVRATRYSLTFRRA